MSGFAIARLALQRILAARVRSFLTMLGVIIGVASLVALTSIVNGAISGITGSLSALGSSRITVSAQSDTYLTDADDAAIAALPGVAQTSGQAATRGTVGFGAQETTASLTGVSPTYAEVAAPTLAAGAFLPDWAEAGDSRTAVISSATADALGVRGSDIGRTITVAGSDFLLVGILDDAQGFGADGAVYLPLATARGMFAATPYLGTITVEVDDPDRIEEVQAAINATLKARHSLAGDDAPFSVTNFAALVSTLATVQATLSLLLGGIASISLVVGGIGIMNIMLVSVRERTIEIGIRRAIGARRRHILTQFIIEATVLSLTGGVIGLGLGIGVSAIVAALGGWAFTLEPATFALALGFSALVGIVFGTWPAQVAARLQPVDALRFE
ncbi:ABC transporter permease [Microlunatus parietis]|uniref:Putative ABC transport system permease protein n=1 Tax=Microlunatus parietis TaxID=682979 RepID=A0A7Y9I3D5_9ACTN|nr:ABC transporter permease [Microlunatus parietis]NYE69513.1 putative ABC transport system permease protein [Microlunatus parietis]